MKSEQACQVVSFRAKSRNLHLTLFALFSIAGIARKQPAPYHHYRTLETPHFNVHVPAGLEREGRVAGAAAERAYSLLARELHEPRGRIELVVSDDAECTDTAAQLRTLRK